MKPAFNYFSQYSVIGKGDLFTEGGHSIGYFQKFKPSQHVVKTAIELSGD